MARRRGTCPTCQSPVSPGALECPICGSELAAEDSFECFGSYDPSSGRCVECPAADACRERSGPAGEGIGFPGFELSAKTLSQLFHRFLFVFVLTDFALTLLLSLGVLKFLTYLFPHLWEMVDIKWLFLGLAIAALDAYLHDRETKANLTLSFIPSLLILGGLANGLLVTEEMGQIMAMGVLFVLSAVTIYLDFSYLLEYPETEGGTRFFDPRREVVWRGRLYMAEGRLEEASREFGRAIGLEPENPSAWLYKGEALHKLGRPEEGIRCAERAIQYDPANPEPYYWRARMLNEGGRKNDAFQTLNRALQIDPEYKKAWELAGDILRELGKLAEAERCYDRAVRLDASDAVAWNKKGELAMERALSGDTYSYGVEQGLIEETLSISAVSGEPMLSEMSIGPAGAGGEQLPKLARQAESSARRGTARPPKPAETGGKRRRERPAPGEKRQPKRRKETSKREEVEEAWEGELDAMLDEALKDGGRKGSEVKVGGRKRKAERKKPRKKRTPRKRPTKVKKREPGKPKKLEKKPPVQKKAPIPLKQGEKEKKPSQGEDESDAERGGERSGMEEPDGGAGTDLSIGGEEESVEIMEGEEEELACPLCGTPIAESDTRCRNCGAKISYHCPECDAEISPSDETCGVCGTELD